MRRKMRVRRGGLLILILLAGCGLSADEGPKSVADARSYAHLPGLSRSPHQGLQAELARLRDERMAPADLAANRKSPNSEVMVAVRPNELGVQASLREAWPALSRGMHHEQIERIDPDRDWRLGPVEHEQLRDFVAKTTKQRERFQAAIIKANDGFELDPASGPLVELEFLEPLELGCRAQGLVAVHQLHEGDDLAALESCSLLFAAAERLAHERHIPCRLLAVSIRADALRLLQLMLHHEGLDRDVIGQARQIVSQTLSRWPHDGHAWIGDRASGLIAYEMVRDGHFLSLVDREELAQLEEQNLVRTTARAVMKGVDEDQHFYLIALRRVIASCDRPYYERKVELARIRRDLEARESTDRYPLVAAKLLEDFELVHQRQAEDLARCRAWHAALSLAMGQQPTERDLLNPLTGKSFDVRVAESSISVLAERDEPIEVPQFSPAADSFRARP